jgi:hypothetical protein
MTIKLMAKFCSVAAIVLLVLAALGPAKWAPRTEFGWQVDHFVGYFRDYVDYLFRLAPTFRGRASPHGHRSATGGPANFYTGSLVQS